MGGCPIQTGIDRADKKESAPALPRPRFSVGVTGHRASHPSFPADVTELVAVLKEIFAQIDHALVRKGMPEATAKTSSTRLLTLVADGTDHQAAQLGLEKDWDLVIPLPFGLALNTAINASPTTLSDAKALLAGDLVSDEATGTRAAEIARLAEQGSLFELADEDARLSQIFLDTVSNPEDRTVAGLFAAEVGKRAALAGRILIEQCDLIIAVWDGQTVANVGGTGHTVLTALEAGSPVLWIDPSDPSNWRLLLSPDIQTVLVEPRDRAKETAALAHLTRQAVTLDPDHADSAFAELSAFDADNWRDHSSLSSHAFRRIEALFGETRWSKKFASIRVPYVRPSQLAASSDTPLFASMRGLTGYDERIAVGVDRAILSRFAWLDGISAHLSDRHRSGMIVNFLLGAGAIIAGILYLPLVDVTQKWIFAGIELLLLLAIIFNTAQGRKLRLHERWLQTRRAAEYLRHSPILAILGVARPPGAWPQGTKSRWPEWHARHALREVGLPAARVDKPYLRAAIAALRDHHVEPQRQYHRQKSQRLARVHHAIDRLSERLFLGAVCIVALYLGLVAVSQIGWIEVSWLEKLAKWFTVLAVALPTLGGALAGIRYFGDFERFAEISEVTAEKLDVIAARIDTILAASDDAINYSYVANIVHATDDVVFAEIQNWQAVFSGKIIAVPA